MIHETDQTRALRAGPWGIYVFDATAVIPVTWAQWIHDAAPAWASEFVRIVRAARASGEMVPDPALWSRQVTVLRAAYRALGQLARACDLPVPSLGVYAYRVHQRDNGPAPWPNLYGDPLRTDGGGENDPRAMFYGLGTGEWRRRTLTLVGAVNSRVSDAPYTALELHHRLWLREDGTVWDRAELTAPNPTQTVMAPWDPSARTELEADESAWSCDAPGRPISAWHCVSYAVWWPGPLEADQSLYLSAVVPLAWHWDVIQGVADELEQLGSVGALVERCRNYVALKNLAEAYAAGVALPVDVVTFMARVSKQRWEADEGLQTLEHAGQGIGAAVAAANPLVGALIGLVASLPAMLQEIFGNPIGHFRDSWFRDEPLLESEFLTGEIQGEYRVAPRHPVDAAPEGASIIPMGVGGGPFVATYIPLADVAHVEQKSDGGGEVVGFLTLLWLLARGM